MLRVIWVVLTNQSGILNEIASDMRFESQPRIFNIRFYMAWENDTVEGVAKYY